MSDPFAFGKLQETQLETVLGCLCLLEQKKARVLKFQHHSNGS